MKYVALLRGINVGGNSLVKMADLKVIFEECGLENVSTYINSGNVIFETEEKDLGKLTKKLEETISKTFGVNGRIVLVSLDQLKKVLQNVPAEWKTQNNLRCYLSFMIPPKRPADLVKEIKLKQDIDFVKEGPGVLYMSTLLSGITKSSFSNLAGKEIYKYITIRNYTTTQKLLKLMA
jgi:uncharacterized protein (DUF1697 family)